MTNKTNAKRILGCLIIGALITLINSQTATAEDNIHIYPRDTTIWKKGMDLQKW